MNCKTTSGVVLMAAISMWRISAYATMWLTPFQEAYQKGAEARIEFRVLDDLGSPVQGASVNVFFDMANRSKARKVIVRTDTNGVCVAEEKTKGVLKIKVSCDGYYSSHDEICFIEMGREHKVKGGRWQPWGMKKEMVLRPVRKPVANKPYFSSGKYTMDTGKWLGFDIETYDFVSPNGNGTIADFEVKFEWDGQRGKNFHGMDMIIRFVEPYAGAYYYDRTMTSDFRDAYSANTNEFYQKEFVFYSHPIRNSDGEIVKRDQKLFDMSKSLVVRSRCILNEDGTLNQARYSEIAELSFGCSSKGTWIMFQPIFNPTPNDTNLEPKR